MTPALAFVAALLLTGCAAPEVYHYSWGTVTLEHKAEATAACGPNGTWDNGRRKRFGEHAACWQPGKKELHLPWGAGVKTLLEELCHADGNEDHDACRAIQ